MAERTDQRTRSDPGDAFDPGEFEDLLSEGPATDERTGNDRPGARAGARPGQRPTSGVSSRLRSRAGRVFSPRYFLVALALSMVVGFVAATLLPLGGLSGLAGVLLATLGLGFAADERRYLESGLAGAGAAGVGALLEFVVLSLVGVGLPLVALGAGAGFLAGVAGFYFGRDLRAGVTADLGGG